jgi:exodeoxyribonuclease V alpha subunit
MVTPLTHGVQFRASFLKATPPPTVEGIEKYLGSGMIRGIGPVYAKKLVRAFGETCSRSSSRSQVGLREVTGIGLKRAERIVAGWAEQKVIREIRGGGDQQSGEQTNAIREVTHEPGTPMRSPDPERELMPVAGGAGKTEV